VFSIGPSFARKYFDSGIDTFAKLQKEARKAEGSLLSHAQKMAVIYFAVSAGSRSVTTSLTLA
jgi:hypothetical protein